MHRLRYQECDPWGAFQNVSQIPEKCLEPKNKSSFLGGNMTLGIYGVFLT